VQNVGENLLNIRRVFRVVNALVWIVCVAALFSPAQAQPPQTPTRIVKETFFGHVVEDPYRWLEDLKDAEVQEWLRQQNDYTQYVLDKVSARRQILSEIEQFDAKASPPLTDLGRDDRGRLYYYRNGPAGFAVGYIFDPSTGRERTLIDPQKLAGPGKTPLKVSGISPSPDGKYVAFRVRSGPRATVYVLDTSTAKIVGTPVENVLGFTGLDWDADSKSIFIVKLPPMRADMKPSEAFLNGAAYRHVVGTDPTDDTLIVASNEKGDVEVPSTAWPFAFVLPDKKHLAVWIEDGARSGHALYTALRSDVLAGNGRWKKLADFDDGVTQVVFQNREAFILASGGASGKPQILRLKLDKDDITTAEKIVLPGTDVVVSQIAAAADAAYVTATEGFSSVFYRITSTGKPERIEPPVPGSVNPVLVDPTHPGGLFRVTSWTSSPSLFRYTPRAGWREMKSLEPSSIGSGIELVANTISVVSHDGVKIPLTIIHPKNIKLDGSNPAYIIGYGSYGAGSLDPTFDSFYLPWFERGGIFAIAHVRGGGELGEAWHAAGSKEKKPNTWLDFIACAQYLIDQKYTSPAKLAGGGTSAGGILIGRAITERPDLFRAALISVGTTDMLRAEYQMNGPANVAEFGTTKDKNSFEQLLEMSAYHHVVKGKRYPAVMLTTGMKDPNVDVWQPAKMTAILQSVADADRPVLLRIDPEAGHDQYGSSRAQIQTWRADQLAFLVWQLGVAQ
jgi:prolyl oligopeptidase